MYLKRKTRRLVGRMLEDQHDADTGFKKDLSAPVQRLLEMYLDDEITRGPVLNSRDQAAG